MNLQSPQYWQYSPSVQGVLCPHSVLSVYSDRSETASGEVVIFQSIKREGLFIFAKVWTIGEGGGQKPQIFGQCANKIKKGYLMRYLIMKFENFHFNFLSASQLYFILWDDSKVGSTFFMRPLNQKLWNFLIFFNFEVIYTCILPRPMVLKEPKEEA